MSANCGGIEDGLGLSCKATLPAVTIFLLLLPASLPAIPLEELDPSRERKLRQLVISGNEHVGAAELQEAMSTKARPWYAVWQARPPFDPAVFASDLKRIVNLYRDKGYYETRVSHDLEVDEDENLVTAKVDIAEGEPIRVTRLTIRILDAPELRPELNAIVSKLPLAEGQIFVAEAYQQTEARLRGFFYDRGRARVEIGRRAEVILDTREARVSYELTAGPPAVFGATELTGLKDVTASVIRRELEYKPGEPFTGKALRETEKNLRQLDLFSQIRLAPQPNPADPTTVPIEIHLEEKPPREIRVGIGYGTEDQLRGQLRWRHNNWLGGARKLELGVKASLIARELDFQFLQPHFLGLNNRLLVKFGPQQFDEPGYFLNTTRLQPRFEREFSERLTGFIGYRAEYDRLSEVNDATRRALGPFREKGLLSALGAGLLWNPVDDPLNPTKGWSVSLLAETAGGFLGGAFSLYKFQAEAKGYYPLLEKTVLASRIKLGFAEPFGNTREVPLFERFYAGGTNSVRGYGHSRLGPLSASNDPLGGRSLIEGSIELRQQFTQQLGGAVFLDFGQVSLRSFDPAVDDLRFSAGFGVRYTTPVGPLRFDLGFPFRPPRDGRSWQIHFSIGQFF
ncbi:MAG TPA: outer membrane protein assembly factor BamA [Candidatus Acidoferrales bacterium]|nr:outer membrane protein assembly factor BamA [Candidatus Acidoferrales bacterium]